MVVMKNGVLYQEGKPVFGIGVSYYPSYHPQKVPVPPEGDRIGEMERDLADMANAGFNIVRMAALGEVKRGADGIILDCDFIDRLIAKAGDSGLACMVRLQGYGVNLSGYTDNLMLDQNGAEMPFHWGWFVRNCLNHPGILADNEEATRASAAHFSRFNSVVGFQIYNEPAYPAKEYFDYNPHSIRAWRKWMSERGYAANADTLEPPRRRPVTQDERVLWMRWRLFHYERMNDFLSELAEVAKQSAPVPETFTCHMACPALAGATMRGEDYFRIAESLDIEGITHYIPAIGMSYFAASEVLDMTESAAACHGKHAWLIEYNARTDMSANEWERETYSAVGSGFKGILYYQWRADYPYADGPEPEGFGMVFNDRRHTVKYDRAILMNKLLSLLGGYFVKAERVRSGAAVMFSENVNAYFDALDNGQETDVAQDRERSAAFMKTIYMDFKKASVSVDFVRAREIEPNVLGVKLLLVPSLEGLAEEEKTAICDFSEAGGRVFVYSPGAMGYVALGDSASVAFDAAGVLERCGIDAMYRCSERMLDVKLLKGNDCYIACLVNFNPLERPIAAGKSLSLRLQDSGDLRTAKLFDPDGEAELQISRNGADEIALVLPRITMGAFIVLGTS